MAIAAAPTPTPNLAAQLRQLAATSGGAKGPDGKPLSKELEKLAELLDGFEKLAGGKGAGADAIKDMGSKASMQGAQAMAKACSSCGGGQAAQGAGGAQGAQGAGPAQALGAAAGAAGKSASPMGASDPMAKNALGGGKGGMVDPMNSGMMFEDMVAKFMFDTLKQMQEEIKKMMAKYKAMSAAGAAMGQGAAATAASESRQLLFEQLKNEMQKMQQMVQSLSNVLNTMHQGSMNAIRNIRA